MGQFMQIVNGVNQFLGILGVILSIWAPSRSVLFWRAPHEGVPGWHEGEHRCRVVCGSRMI